jgi:phage gpG-like protein
MRLTLTITGAAEAAALLTAAADRLEQTTRPLLEALAAALQTYLQAHIQSETGPEGPWPALAPATQHIRQYYGYPPDSPKLLRSGDLLHSITTLSLADAADAFGAGEVTVGTRLPAARILQDGGTLTDPRTGRARTVQPFPFAYVTETELAALVDLLTAYFFGDSSAP